MYQSPTNRRPNEAVKTIQEIRQTPFNSCWGYKGSEIAQFSIKIKPASSLRTGQDTKHIRGRWVGVSLNTSTYKQQSTYARCLTNVLYSSSLGRHTPPLCWKEVANRAIPSADLSLKPSDLTTVTRLK